MDSDVVLETGDGQVKDVYRTGGGAAGQLVVNRLRAPLFNKPPRNDFMAYKIPACLVVRSTYN